MQLNVRAVFTIVVFATIRFYSYAQQSVSFSIIPKPVTLVPNHLPVILHASSSIRFDAALEKQAVYLQQQISDQCGLHLDLSGKKGSAIVLGLSHDLNRPESYVLRTVKDAVLIEGADIKGVVNGIQTLLQLLPLKVVPQVTVPGVNISDYPAFPYRGMHLDVVRHFFDVGYIKKYLDYLAFHKYNRFHWHLTDDQGWRIEMLQYKKLNEIGSWRNATLIGHFRDTPARYDSTRYGGYYTRDQIKDIIEYAAVRGIEVIPEIDIPGHSRAIIASYPEFSTRPDTTWSVAITWGMFNRQNNVLAPKKETFDFLKTVYQEIADLFPSPYIHIGGDECSKIWWKRDTATQRFIRENGLKDEDDLQAYFIRQVADYLKEKGKKIIGWHEITEGELDTSAVVMNWKDDGPAIAAAKKNHFVIMTPQVPLYFNQDQSKDKHDSLTAGGYNSLEAVYSFNPIPRALDNKTDRYRILGAQGNVWTEYIAWPSKVDYMVFPRMTALSEVLWTDKGQRNFADFRQRLDKMYTRYQFWGSSYFREQ